MQYALLIYSDESRSEAERASVLQEYAKLTVDLRGEGKLLAAQELQPTGTAPNNTFATDHKCAFWARLGF